MIDAYATLGELSRALRAKEVSSVELTKFFLERLEKFGATLGAVIAITRERALREAQLADADIAAGNTQNRPLLGIPYGVKDLLATKDAPTTWGAEPYRNQQFDSDADVIEKLSRGGAVLVAKLAMVELAGGFGYNNADASFTGPGRTPWNLDFWSGGSSTGPGAAVGASRRGAMALSWTLDKIGPMARTAADCNTVFGVIVDQSSGVFPSGRASWVNSDVLGRPANKRALRIGLPKGAWENAQPAVRENFLKSVEVLRSLGHTITEIDYPDLPYGPAVSVIVDAEGASAFEDILRDGRAKLLRAKSDQIGGYESAATLAIDYLRAQRVRKKVRATLTTLFESIDLLASPTRSTVAFPIGPNFDEAYPGIRGGPAVIPSMNLLGAPAVAMPNGFGENGLPTSIQLNAAPANEVLLMNAAIHFQNATDHHTKRPPKFP